MFLRLPRSSLFPYTTLFRSLEDVLGKLIFEAIRQQGAMIYALGSRWGPEPHTPDRYFGFIPGNGVHDIHMNQDRKSTRLNSSHANISFAVFLLKKKIHNTNV